jgi:hypothetical protein
MVTNGDFGPNATLTKPRLEWVLTYSHSTLQIFGGVGSVPSPAPSPETDCVYTVLEDANTGADLGSYQSCGAD